MHLAAASSFITIEYNLERNRLSFEIPHTKDLEGEVESDIIDEYGVESISEGIIMKAIYSALNILELKDREEERIKARHINIWSRNRLGDFFLCCFLTSYP